MYKVLADCRGMDNGEILEEIMLIRKVDMDFFEPNENDFISPDRLKNIDIAAKKIENAINNNMRIIIHYDTDTDGISSGTIMNNYLIDCGAKNIVKVINEGKSHGLENFDKTIFESDEPTLLIIVDSLDSTTKYYSEISDKGIDIIVFDHHAIKSNDYDDIITLVSSQREDYQNKFLCGAGVVMKFCLYYDELNDTNFADKYWDLATVGTIADMMDLSVMDNRYICKKGFENIQNPLITKIVGGFDFNATSVAFSIAPRINACNRMNYNTYAVDAFQVSDKDELKIYAKQLEDVKKMQAKYVDMLYPKCVEMCEEQKNESVMFCVFDETYNVAGLIGNKLLGMYNRPVLVLTKGKNSISGSARAVILDDFRKMCEDTGLCNAAGHELAFGIDIPIENFDEFVKVIREEVSKEIEIAPEVINKVDIRLNAEDINSSLVDMFEEINKITGTGFKPVTVAITVDDYEIGDMSGGKHLVVKTPYLNFIQWNFTGNFEDMEDYAMMSQPITFIGELSNGYIGRTFMNKLIINEMVIENG